MMQVIEWAQFRTKEGVSEEQVHAEARKAHDWLSIQPGYLERRLTRSDDGGWVDCLFWVDMQTAKEAAGCIHDAPETQGFLALMLPDQIDVRHFEVHIQF
jgi:hypothetical protein